MAGQRQVAAQRAVDLVPPKDSHARGENCEQRQDDSEHVARAGDRQLRDKLDYGDSRGQQTKRGALPGQKRSFVRQGEAVVRLDLGHTVVVAHQLNLTKLRPLKPGNEHGARTTRSNDLLAGRLFSNVVSSMRLPFSAATLAMRESGSTARTSAPASINCADAMPAPASTSSARR